MVELAIGMTVGLRKNKKTVYDYCQQAVISLRQAGFNETVHAFVEPGAAIHLPDKDRWNVKHIQNKEKLCCFPNFKSGLQWLVDNTEADWFLMLQDDAVWRKDGHAQVLEAISTKSFQGVGMLSPYTSKAMVPPKFMNTKDKDNKWVECKFYNRAFWGAVAMMFPRKAAIALLTKSKRFIEHKHSRKLDVVVGNALRRELEMKILIHVPSLVDHVGSWSTLGRHRIKGNQWGRRGYKFREK